MVTKLMLNPDTQAADARQRILQASGELFAERGFDKVTYDDIAESASVSKTTIYKLFEEKIDILSEYVADVLNNAPRSWYTIFSSDHSMENTLSAFGEEYLRHIIKPEVIHVFSTLAYFRERIDAKSKVCICILPHDLCDIMKDRFLQWNREGKISSGDSVLLIYQFIGMLRGVVYPRIMFQRGFVLSDTDIQKVVRQAVDVMLHGVSRDPDKLWT